MGFSCAAVSHLSQEGLEGEALPLIPLSGSAQQQHSTCSLLPAGMRLWGRSATGSAKLPREGAAWAGCAGEPSWMGKVPLGLPSLLPAGHLPAEFSLMKPCWGGTQGHSVTVPSKITKTA